jgi:hypothetical protein
MAAIKAAIQEDEKQAQRLAKRAGKCKEINEDNDNVSPPLTISPTLTKALHPGYPYQEKGFDNLNIAPNTLPRPYVAIQVDKSNSNPCIYGKKEKDTPTYDEGPLYAQEVNPVDNDFEAQVVSYPWGEDTYLDTNFLQALKTIGDRGLMAKEL